ncbi:MAG: hypothetical protein MR408_05615 [Spirochaetia bacterium]|nr:hypothetical protein [Spirochaetia bacterium]
MKLQKFLIEILFFSFIFFSCATTKNASSVSSVKDDSEILKEQEELAVSEETQEENLNEEPFLEEKVTEEELPPLEIPEENQTEEAKIEKIETENELSPIENIFSEEDQQEEPEIIDIKEEIPEIPEDYTNIIEESSKTTEENSNKDDEIKSDEKTLGSQEENNDILEFPFQDENSEGFIQVESENSLDENQTEEIQEKSEIIPSRSVSMKNYQYLDIVYPGNGWIYLGESDNSKNFIFYGRKLGGKDTSFTLRSKNPGRFILHFYKNDAITGNFIDDYLEVIVDDEKSSSNEHILCPMYKEIVPPKYEKNQVKEENLQKEELLQENKNTTEASPQEKTQTEKEEQDIQGKTVIQNASSLQDENSLEKTVSPENSLKSENPQNPLETQKEEIESLPVELLLDKAQELYEQKNYEEAKKVLDKFMLSSVSKIDEALFLQGKILEAKSPVQNIKGAVDSYDLIVKRYPKSKFWTQANKRSIYLKRFYININ